LGGVTGSNGVTNLVENHVISIAGSEEIVMMGDT